MPAVRKLVIFNSTLRTIRKSPEMQQVIDETVAEIADAAGEGFFPHTEMQKNRVRGSVVAAWAQAQAAERRDRALTAAVDAGRRGH